MLGYSSQWGLGDAGAALQKLMESQPPVHLDVPSSSIITSKSMAQSTKGLGMSLMKGNKKRVEPGIIYFLAISP